MATTLGHIRSIRLYSLLIPTMPLHMVSYVEPLSDLHVLTVIRSRRGCANGYNGPASLQRTHELQLHTQT